MGVKLQAASTCCARSTAISRKQAVILFLFYDATPTLIANRVTGFEQGTVVSNAHNWQVS